MPKTWMEDSWCVGLRDFLLFSSCGLERGQGQRAVRMKGRRRGSLAEAVTLVTSAKQADVCLGGLAQDANASRAQQFLSRVSTRAPLKNRRKGVSNNGC